MFMDLCFVLFLFCLSTCACICFMSKVHCGSAFEPGASGLPYYCTPPVCVPDVIGGLAVWLHNKKNCNQPLGDVPEGVSLSRATSMFIKHLFMASSDSATSSASLFVFLSLVSSCFFCFLFGSSLTARHLFVRALPNSSIRTHYIPSVA